MSKVQASEEAGGRLEEAWHCGVGKNHPARKFYRVHDSACKGAMGFSFKRVGSCGCRNPYTLSPKAWSQTVVSIRVRPSRRKASALVRLIRFTWLGYVDFYMYLNRALQKEQHV